MNGPVSSGQLMKLTKRDMDVENERFQKMHFTCDHHAWGGMLCPCALSRKTWKLLDAEDEGGAFVNMWIISIICKCIVNYIGWIPLVGFIYARREDEVSVGLAVAVTVSFIASLIQLLALFLPVKAALGARELLVRKLDRQPAEDNYMVFIFALCGCHCFPLLADFRTTKETLRLRRQVELQEQLLNDPEMVGQMVKARNTLGHMIQGAAKKLEKAGHHH